MALEAAGGKEWTDDALVAHLLVIQVSSMSLAGGHGWGRLAAVEIFPSEGLGQAFSKRDSSHAR